MSTDWLDAERVAEAREILEQPGMVGMHYIPAEGVKDYGTVSALAYEIVCAIAALPEPPKEHFHYVQEQGQAGFSRWLCTDPGCVQFRYARIWLACRAALGKGGSDAT